MSDPSNKPILPGDHVYLVDGSSYIFRAYHALPPLTRKSDNLPVGAVAGFCNMLWRLLKDSQADDKPSHFAVILDASGATFRNEIYSEYKANRSETPEDLIPQFALIRDAVRAFNIACVELIGFEADDLIATYAMQAADAGATVKIVASDKDLMQLVGPSVVMLDTMKNRLMAEPEVMEKFGVTPDKVIEVQALAGDSVDNIPGVPGIGVKTAAQLINEYGDLETLLARADEIKQPKRRDSLIEFADQARLSHQLVTLRQDVPIEVPLADLAVREPVADQLIGFLKALEFTTLTKRVATALDTDLDSIPADPAFRAASGTPNALASSGQSAEGAGTPVGDDADTNSPDALAAKRLAEAPALPIDPASYKAVTKLDDLDQWIAEAHRVGVIAVDTETTSLDAMQAGLVGISLATAPGRACYIPLAHRASDGLALEGPAEIEQIDFDAALDRLKPLLEDPSVLKVGQNMKYDLLVMSRCGIDIAPFDDTMLMSYVLDAGRGSHGMDAMSVRYLGHTPIPFKEVAGTGKKQITFDLVPLDIAIAYAAEDADVTLRLYQVLKARLVAENMVTVYARLERPLAQILANMERAGIKVERQILARLSAEFAAGLKEIEAGLEGLAGQPFNPGSPKQVGEILFGKLGLPGAKKTPTGAYATGADILEDLAGAGHELPAKLLEWRQLAKLKSTYTDALPTFINPETGRVHTSFSLAATTTGRLSSSDPNVQNIPVRSEAGRRIRTAFVAEAGNKLISADYSQIELRVLAHIANIPALRQAFADGLDIHAMTASEMFNTPIEGMDPMVRRRAKAINFGIIYGISAFGLANQLNISRTEAKDYIDSYFERFPGIRDYMDATKTFCRDHGYVETIFGRRCHYPEISAKNPAQRAFNERAAINAPIQGSAADIIRRAMVRMPSALEGAGLHARMLLQVHDELIFEAPENECDRVIQVAREIMVKAPEPALLLNVPLQIDATAAANWDEAH